MKNERFKEILKTSAIGIAVNVLLAAFKTAIGIISNSIAITLDAVNNLTDAISSVITIVGTYLAGKDPNKKHPFGYGRIEYLSTMAIGVLITYAGVTAGIESIKNIFEKSVPDYSTVMLIVIAVAVLTKILLGLFFVKKGKSSKSDSLVASGKDALLDSIISAATILAAVIFIVFHISLEAYLGVIISCLIIKAGIDILMDTVSKILGEGASVDLVKSIKKSIAAYEGVRGAYDLVFHNYGEDYYIASVHIEIEESVTATELDVLTRHITEDIYKEYGVYLSAIGIYAYNSQNEEVIKMRENVAKIATSHEYVHQIHGFYVNLEEKKIRFDMVISFDAPSRADLYIHVMSDLGREYPDYEISAGMDADFNEV